MVEIAEAVETRKARMRAAVRQVLAQLPGDCSALDAAVMAGIREAVRLHSPVTAVAAFMAIRREPDVTPLFEEFLAAGQQVFLPRYIPDLNAYEMVQIHDVRTDLTVGRYGILEPVRFLPGSDVSAWSASGAMWLVPGLAFDSQGHRLGRGRGYYDRLLQGAGGVKVGVAYDCQLVDAVPSEIHDVCMDCVVTESRIFAMA